MRKNWVYKKLGEVGKISSGKAISSNLIKEKYVDGLYPCYGGNGLRGFVSNFLYDGTYPIIGRVGALCGNVHLADGRFYPTEHALVMFLKDNDCPAYIVYLLKSLNLNQYAKGVAQPVLSASTLSAIIVPIPPLAEQSRIVSELDLLQGIIDKKTAQLQDLDALAQSIFYEMFGDPIENEKGWEMKMMESVCEKIVDCPHSTPKKVNYKTNYPCIRTSELKQGSIKWDSMQYLEKEEYEKRIARLKPEAGDIVFGREGTIGDSVILPEGPNFCLGQRTMLLRAKSELISNIFLHRTLLSEWIKQQINMLNVSSTVAHINIKDFKKLSIPLPPLSLQQKFAEKIEAIEKQKQIVTVTKRDLETLLASRMQYWFE